jgi:hypothetical protein
LDVVNAKSTAINIVNLLLHIYLGLYLKSENPMGGPLVSYVWSIIGHCENNLGAASANYPGLLLDYYLVEQPI